MILLRREGMLAVTLVMVLLLIFLVCDVELVPREKINTRHAVTKLTDKAAQPLSAIKMETEALVAPVQASTILNRLHSLRGAQLPDGLRVDEQGDLVADMDLKLLFDFLLAARHDVDDEQLQTLLRLLATQNLPDIAAGQALALWGQYQGYQSALAQLIMDTPVSTELHHANAQDLDQIQQFMLAREQLQQSTMGALADRWFAADNAYDRQMLARVQHHFSSSDNVPAESSRQPPRITASIPANPEYERLRAVVLQSPGLSAQDKAVQLDAMRAEIFTDSKDYIRQSLRDLARPVPR